MLRRALAALFAVFALLPLTTPTRAEPLDDSFHHARVMANVLMMRHGMETNEYLRNIPGMTPALIRYDIDRMAQTAKRLATNPGLYPDWVVYEIPLNSVVPVMDAIDACFDMEILAPSTLPTPLIGNELVGCVTFSAAAASAHGLTADIPYFAMITPNPDQTTALMYVLDENGTLLAPPWNARWPPANTSANAN